MQEEDIVEKLEEENQTKEEQEAIKMPQELSNSTEDSLPVKQRAKP